MTQRLQCLLKPDQGELEHLFPLFMAKIVHIQNVDFEPKTVKMPIGDKQALLVTSGTAAWLDSLSHQCILIYSLRSLWSWSFCQRTNPPPFLIAMTPIK